MYTGNKYQLNIHAYLMQPVVQSWYDGEDWPSQTWIVDHLDWLVRHLWVLDPLEQGGSEVILTDLDDTSNTASRFFIRKIHQLRVNRAVSPLPPQNHINMDVLQDINMDEILPNNWIWIHILIVFLCNKHTTNCCSCSFSIYTHSYVCISKHFFFLI